MPDYSPRGAELITLERLFADFLVKRHAVLDHVSAHRELLKIMTG